MTDRHPEIGYDGPTEYTPAWNAFATHYVQAHTYGAAGADLLNTLAFGSGATAIARQSPNPSDFCDAKWNIEVCATELARKALCDNDLECIRNRMLGNLLQQWVELETQHGLYPPPRIGNGRGVTDAEERRVHRKRHAFLRSQKEAALIAGTLQSALKDIIAAAVRRTAAHYN